MPLKSLGITPAAILVAGGEDSIQPNQPTDESTQIVWAHTLDYDLYLNEKNESRDSDANLGVFLDEYLPFHPDFAHSGIATPSAPENYYPRLREFFNLIEREHKVRIVIAAHPRSRYEQHPDYFGGRLIVREKTAELLHQAGFAIAHASTAINLAAQR